MVVRVWVVSGLVIGVVVAAILVFSGPSAKDAPRRASRPPPPSPLTEQEVRAYLAVWPRINQVLAAAVPESIQRHKAGASQEELGREVQAAIDVILVDHHLTQEGWNKLRDRVEYAVDVVRWRDEAGERNTRLDTQIQQKESLLELTTGKEKEALEADIAKLKAQRVDAGPALRKHDVELVRSFWQDLDRITPARGSPPKKKKGN